MVSVAVVYFGAELNQYCAFLVAAAFTVNFESFLRENSEVLALSWVGLAPRSAFKRWLCALVLSFDGLVLVVLKFFVLRDPLQMEAVEGRVAHRQIVFRRDEVRIVPKISVGDPRDLIRLFCVVVDAKLVCSAV